MKAFSQFRIGTKLFIAVGSATLAGIVAAVLILQAALGYKHAEESSVTKAEAVEVLAKKASAESKTMANETLAFLLTSNPKHEKRKLAADDAAGAAFDKAEQGAKDLKGAKEVVADLQAIRAWDEEKCNVVENAMIAAAKAGNSQQAIRVYEQDYAPAREHLEQLIQKLVDRLSANLAAERKMAKENVTRAIWLGFGIGAALFALALVMSGMICRGLVGSAKTLAKALGGMREGCLASLSMSLQAIARGDLTQEVICSTETVPVHCHDEIGKMIETFNEMSTEMDASIVSYNTARVSLIQLVSQLGETSKSVAAMSKTLAAASHQSDIAASDIAEGSEKLAARAQQSALAMNHLESATRAMGSSSTEQNSIVERAGGAMATTFSAVEEMRLSLHQVQDLARNGDQSVRATVETMDQVTRIVEGASTQVQELDAQAQQIGTIIGTIRRIAEQTNLLSLNAAIEAARAGEQGRGFAVVADEVRKLAEEAANSTKEITGLVTAISDAVKKTVAAMQETSEGVDAGARRSEEAGSALSQIVQGAGKVAADCEGLTLSAQSVSALMTDVATAASENAQLTLDMTSHSNTVIESIADVAAVSHQSAAGAQELSASLEEVKNAARDLASMANEMELAVGQFACSHSYDPALAEAA